MPTLVQMHSWNFANQKLYSVFSPLSNGNHRTCYYGLLTKMHEEPNRMLPKGYVLLIQWHAYNHFCNASLHILSFCSSTKQLKTENWKFHSLEIITKVIAPAPANEKRWNTEKHMKAIFELCNASKSMNKHAFQCLCHILKLA